MTSIIQSNRERKSRLDEGLIERLNTGTNAEPEIVTKTDEKSVHINPAFELITDMISYIRGYGRDKFRKSWYTISKTVQMEDKVLVGTNPYYAVAVDMFLKEKRPEYRLATLADVTINPNAVKNYVIDLGLVIRDRNNQQAKKILDQIDAPFDPTPCWLDLRGLELDDDLNFIITKESTYDMHPSLNWPTCTSFSQTCGSGLPKIEDRTSLQRRIYTSADSLSRGWIKQGNIGCYKSNLFKTGLNYTIAIVKVK